MRAPFLRYTTLNVNHVCLLHVYKNVRDGKLEVVPPPVRPVEEQQQIRFEMQQEVCSEPAIATFQARECDLIWGDAIWSYRVKNMSKVCEDLHPLNMLRNNCKKQEMTKWCHGHEQIMKGCQRWTSFRMWACMCQVSCALREPKYSQTHSSGWKHKCESHIRVCPVLLMWCFLIENGFYQKPIDRPRPLYRDPSKFPNDLWDPYCLWNNNIHSTIENIDSATIIIVHTCAGDTLHRSNRATWLLFGNLTADKYKPPSTCPKEDQREVVMAFASPRKG